MESAMTTEAASNSLTGSRAKKLLRLYLAWPHRFEADPETEARQFFKWLKENYADVSVISSLTHERDVAAFLSCSPEIIEAARFLKPSPAVEKGMRRDRRISTNTHVLIGIYDCSADSSLIGHNLRGLVVDVTPNGIGVEVTEPLPDGAILNMTVASAGHPIVLYRVTGEVRWVSGVDDRYQVGIKLFDVDEASRWRNDFDARFRTNV